MMNIATQKNQPYEAEVLQFWATQAQLQQTAFDALADYLSMASTAPLACAQAATGRHTH
ncbi:hypothetical protein KZO25_05190 [Halomonas sp. ANAO-440]|uniref:Uncharacterized protein n=1 Tax=Halomonas chromatireducens TaxID=507626 RepID=A0A109UN20_9GAMM|nr:hypothetical protein [Halomonas sp. ANAO-440]AMD02257.1 hypothetical protein LOKO_03211 [Halomonas chromatireducens]MBZ0329713.1 hypothetical protein [Halomonas sp. ANAO-440]